MSFIIVDIFPKAMAITPEELKLWEEDPIQFVTRIYDVYYEFTNVRMEAGNFLSYLSKVRANDILSLFLNFMTQTFDLVYAGFLAVQLLAAVIFSILYVLWMGWICVIRQRQ